MYQIKNEKIRDFFQHLLLAEKKLRTINILIILIKKQ